MLGLGIVSLLHFFAQITAPDRLMSQMTQVLLVPWMIAFVLVSVPRKRSRSIVLTVTVLLCSWMGDTVPRFLEGDAGFLAMVGCFLIAQIFYIALLLRWAGSSVLTRPLWLIPYAAVFLALVAFCAGGAGALLVPIIVYGLALVSMAVLSTGLGVVGGLGGAVFLLSDSLIALRSFTDVEIYLGGLWIMLTYVVGQLLLVIGIVNKDRDEQFLAGSEQ